ncbi:Os08g0113501 [Oryza sativa Japonica Group]|uniref:Os08g0113501 protein n=1 Tax=Oryza sativa subsp. japonica TaxID=39947 RepID=A0A0N7KP62_ORYSJ|nr:hypothetical protein EE612_041762 [Oryza sativa]BAT03530.1 Os08g0113501 [Oryza sativa Japonica Group]
MRETILVHDPAAAKPLGRLADVEDERLLEADRTVTLHLHHPIRPCGLPVPRWRHSVGPIAVSVLAVPWHIEEPLLVPN